MSTERLGKVSIVPKGAWTAGTTYTKYDAVQDNGNGYIAKKASTNVPTSNTEYWFKFADKGDVGPAAGFGTPTITASQLPAGSAPTASITASGTDIAKIFAFALGIPTGATGVGIASISRTDRQGLVDTYTVTYTDGNTMTFTVTNGAKGDTGDAAGFGTPSVSVDSNVGTPYATVTASGPATAKIFEFSFHNVKGDTGATGPTGNGISSVVLNADYTLTINFTNGTSITTASIRGATGATGATGNGISSIAKTATVGNVDTYTITFTDASTTTFNVTNGIVQSVNGISQAAVVLDGSNINVDGTAQSPVSVKAAITQQSGQIVTLDAKLSSKAASASDVGKFAKVKTVENGTVTEWEFGEGGGGGGGDVDYLTVVNGELCIKYTEV